MGFEGTVEARFVDVHRIGILHREFAHPEESALGPRLVSKLGLELVPGLGEFLIRAKFAGQVGKDLLVGHPQADITAPAILELEHLAAHFRPAPAAIPDFPGMEAGQTKFLGPAAIHLLANDLFDLLEHPLSQGQQGIDTRHQLAHETGTHQQLMAHRLGVGRVIAQGRYEDSRPEQGILLEYPEGYGLESWGENSRRSAHWPAG